MNLETTTRVYGHKFSLNIAVKVGLDWTGKAPLYTHYCVIELGDDQAVAEFEAGNIIAKFGRDCFKFTLRAEPKVATYSEEL